jgi:hypothetical protein
MADVPFIPFHAKVRVKTADPAKAPINGRLGRIAGMTERPNDDGRFGYGVFVYDLAEVRCCNEAELDVTGELDEDALRMSEEHRVRLAAKHAG